MSISAARLLREANEGVQRPVSYRQLDHWIKTKAIVPDQPANGSGSTRRFLPSDVARLRRISRAWCLFGTYGVERRWVTALWNSDPTVPAILQRDGCVIKLPAEKERRRPVRRVAS